MTTRSSLRNASLALLTTLALGACGAAEVSPLAAAGQSVQVEVSPQDAQVAKAGQVQYATAVTGTSDTAVTWQVVETSGGTIAATGLYTAPSTNGTYHVKATSVADPTVSATAVVTVTAAPVVAVAVTPRTPSVTAGGKVTITASVTGTSNTVVTWSVREASGCGSVSAAGVYTAPAAAATCHVVATSAADATKSATSTVTVTSATCTPAVCRPAVDCGNISDGCGGTLACGNTCSGSATCGGGGTPNICGGGGSSGLFLGGFFPIGAYGQPSQEFASWKAIGANTVQGVPNSYTAEWAAQARSLGMKQIRNPVGATGATPPTAGNYSSLNSDPDKGTGNVIAWEGVMPNSSGWDEIEFSIGVGASTANYAINTGNALHSLDPATPTFLNSGINGLGPTASGWPYSGGSYSYTTLFQSIDWVCNDIYPYGGSSYNDNELRGSMGGDHVVTAQDVANFPVLAPIQGKGAVASIGAITDKLRAVLPTKAFFSFIEAGCVTSNSPVVPPGGIRAEMWNAIIHGARGIMIFAYAGQLNNATSDGGGCAAIPAVNAAEIRTQSALISSLASVLQDEIDPATIGASASIPALDVGWRDTPSGKYFIVLNATNVNQGSATITVSGTGSATSATVFGESRSVAISGGKITDSFGPYAIHVYVVP